MGDRFSRLWLEGLSEWVSFFRAAILLRTSSKLISCYGVHPQAQETPNKVIPGSVIGEGEASTEAGITFNPSLSMKQDRNSPFGNFQLFKAEALSQRAFMTEKNSVSVHEESLSSPGQSISDMAPLLCDQTNEIETIPAISDSNLCNHHWKCGISTLQHCRHPSMISISMRCEKMEMTDKEVEMLANWLQEHRNSVKCIKLWLFDNKLTDQGVKSITRMMHDGELLTPSCTPYHN